VPSAECRVPSAECRVPSAECRVPSAECRVPSAECRVPSAECRVPIPSGGSLGIESSVTTSLGIDRLLTMRDESRVEEVPYKMFLDDLKVIGEKIEARNAHV
jgi:hypothetical protein